MNVYKNEPFSSLGFQIQEKIERNAKFGGIFDQKW